MTVLAARSMTVLAASDLITTPWSGCESNESPHNHNDLETSNILHSANFRQLHSHRYGQGPDRLDR
jgi:hypothetical protein